MIMKKHRPLKIALSVIGILLALVIAFIGCFLIFASATALKVQDSEVLDISGSANEQINAESSISLLTWNMGYGALDEREDCYWDGGTGVDGESEEVVQENINALKAQIKELNPDIFFLQEMDVNSKRSYNINELESFQEVFTQSEYNSSFALNYKSGFVPLPLYNPMGKVEAGIATFSKFSVNDASRVQLPCPFSWPMSTVNLKRCLLINRLPIENSDKELVLINLHLEAYDDGEGKAKQLAMLMDIMQEEYDKGNYVIAGGDFNQTFSNADYQKYPQLTDWVCPVIEAESYTDFTFKMDATYPSCRSLDKTYADAQKEATEFQYWLLDGFIVSNNITINSFETLDYGFKNTDHNPVVMTISFGDNN